MTHRYAGAFIALGTPDMGRENVPALMGEACWTMLADNMWNASPWRVSRLVRLPARPR